jgi:hypothetical protein
MARQCGHHRYRLPLRILFRTSTGEWRHSRHGTAASSGLFIRVSLGSKEGPNSPEDETRAGLMTHKHDRGVEPREP